MNDNAFHLLIGPYGSPAVECRQHRAKVAMDFRDYHAAVKGGAEQCCKRCAAAYGRRLAAVRARKAQQAKFPLGQE